MYKKRYGKKRYGKKKYTKQLATVSTVQRMISRNVENKFSDFPLDGTWGSVSTAWVELNICDPALGTGAGNRIGSQIRIKSFTMYGVYVGGISQVIGDDPFNVMRMVIAQWNGGVATPLATLGATIDLPINKHRTGNSLRKKYLDKYLTCNVASTEAGAGDGYTPNLYKFKYYKRFNNFLVTYDVAGVADKKLSVGMISDSAAVSHPGFINGYGRVTWEDA